MVVTSLRMNRCPGVIGRDEVLVGKEEGTNEIKSPSKGLLYSSHLLKE